MSVSPSLPLFLSVLSVRSNHVHTQRVRWNLSNWSYEFYVRHSSHRSVNKMRPIRERWIVGCSTACPEITFFIFLQRELVQLICELMIAHTKANDAMNLMTFGPMDGHAVGRVDKVRMSNLCVFNVGQEVVWAWPHDVQVIIVAYILDEVRYLGPR